MLETRISVGPNAFPAQLLLDSGALDTLLDADIAPTLGVDLSQCPTRPVIGLTGSPKDGRICTVRMKFKGIAASRDIKVLFVDELGITGLLGQEEFFSKFNVQFQYATKRFWVNE